MGSFSKSNPIRCPNCGVEDEKNGIFCYSCGGQIIYTSHGSRGKQKGLRLTQVKRLLKLLFLLAVPLLAALYLVGHKLPFCPILSPGFQVETESGRSGTGGPAPEFPRGTGTFVFRCTYFFAPPAVPLKINLYRVPNGKTIWWTKVKASYLAGRICHEYRTPNGTGLPTGTYGLCLSHKGSFVARTQFIVK